MDNAHASFDGKMRNEQVVGSLLQANLSLTSKSQKIYLS